jgi:murein DD-endopeptidase MepM/ murein hydrolase activator NlpD
VLALLVALAVASSSTTVDRMPPTHLDWPAQGTITTPYGVDGHPGIDIGILRSLNVRAAAPGRVLLVGSQTGYEGYGNIVLVEIGGGYSNLYAHLSRWRVRRGQRVEADQRLGTAGCTGWCTGTHLHFELRLHGRPVSPYRISLR